METWWATRFRGTSHTRHHLLRWVTWITCIMYLIHLCTHLLMLPAAHSMEQIFLCYGRFVFKVWVTAGLDRLSNSPLLRFDVFASGFSTDCRNGMQILYQIGCMFCRSLYYVEPRRAIEKPWPIWVLIRPGAVYTGYRGQNQTHQQVGAAH